MNKELIARTYGAVFNQDIPTQEVTDGMCSELLDKLREMSDVYRDLYRTVREDLAPEDYGFRECDLWVRGEDLHPRDRTDEDCDKVDMDKYCERQNEGEDAE